ncbi:energy transducer TonB [Bernardetia sp. OM2101]|uniref:energy transducer TonB n=1 Tax=Bernardetia sp. OM2101 TaxID=3344876 RepID=UPI0035CFF930
MTTKSINVLKFALAILLLSNSVFIFYVFKQEQNQNKQNSELKNLNTKLDLLVKNNSESQSKKIPCLQVVIADEKTQELKPVKIEYVKEVLIDSVEDIEYIEAPREEDEIISCMAFSWREVAPEKGIQSFYDYINKNINYPINAKREGIEGKVIVSFVVNKKGEITEVEAKNDIGGGCKEETERVIKNSPKWNPARQRGKTVKVRMSIPIVFKLT